MANNTFKENPVVDPTSQYLALFGEITDKEGAILEKGASALQWANNKLAVRAAGQAFRGFTVKSPILALPTLNKYGNLRGMVTSANWRHIFDVHIQYARDIESIGKFADFLGWANYLAGWAEEIRATSQSEEPWDVKGPKLSFYATTALAKIFIGTAHGLADGVIYAAQAACSLGGALHVKGVPGVSQCSNYGDVARAIVGVGFKNEEEFVSPDNIRAGVISGGSAAITAATNIYGITKSYLTHRLK